MTGQKCGEIKSPHIIFTNKVVNSIPAEINSQSISCVNTVKCLVDTGH